MNPWMIAVLAMLPAFAIPAAACFRGPASGRLVAVQLASSLAALLLVLMTFAFDQPALIDLSLTLVLLTLPGTLVLAFFLGRWL